MPPRSPALYTCPPLRTRTHTHTSNPHTLAPPSPISLEHLTSEDLDEMNIEVMRNTLYKAYLDDFSRFVRSVGGTTAEVMGDLLAFEVGQRRAGLVGRWWFVGGASGVCGLVGGGPP